MRGIDLYLRGHVYGPIAWWIERRWGYSKFAIARFCAISAMFLAVIYFGLTAHWWFGTLVDVFVMLPWLMITHFRLENLKRDEYVASHAPDVHMRIEDMVWPMRLTQLVVFSGFDMLVMSVDAMLEHYGWAWLLIGPARVYMTVFASGSYFSSVPLPPPRQVKERAPLFAKPVVT